MRFSQDDFVKNIYIIASIFAQMENTNLSRSRLEDLQLELKKNFFVRNIPVDWNEWKVFHVFSEFGLVDDVRVKRSPTQTFQFAFVNMVSFEGADAVRNNLSKGSLKADDATLHVDNVRENGAQKSSVEPKEECFSPEKEKENVPPQTKGFGRSHQFNASQLKPKKPTSPVLKERTAKLYSTDFSPNQEIKVKVVSPPSDAPKDRFVFYAKSVEEPNGRYVDMQQAMNAFVRSTPPNGHDCQTNDYVIIVGEEVAYRARIVNISQKTVYLVDFGKEVTASDMWKITNSTASETMHFLLPYLVVECGLFGVTLKPKFFDKMNIMLQTFVAPAELKLKMRSYQGRTNMVQAILSCESEHGLEVRDIAHVIEEKGCGTYKQPERENIQYSKGEMYDVKNSCGEVTLPCFEDPAFADVFTQMNKLNLVH